MRSLLRRFQAGGVPPLETARLRLLPMTQASVEAETAGTAQLAAALQLQVAADWPPRHWEPHVWVHILTQLSAQPETLGWHRYLVLRGAVPLLIGSLGAFPCAAGDVEMGYSVVDSEQRKGYATEAAQAQVAWLLRQPAVHSVSAQTYRSMPESIKVMERSGLQPAGEGDEPGMVRYRRWR